MFLVKKMFHKTIFKKFLDNKRSKPKMPNEHKKWNTINGSLTLNKNNNKNRITPKMKNPE